MASKELNKFGGGDLEFLKGKTPRQKMPHIRGSIVSILITILDRYKEIILAWYILFINGIFFINTISRHLKFKVAEYIANSEATTLQESIQPFKQFYMYRGFKVTNILVERQLTCIRGDLVELQINLNVFSKYEHVGEIKRINITVK